MKKNEKIYGYEIEYASGILRTNGRNNTEILSKKKLKIGQFVIVEHKDCGVFIGRVIDDITDNLDEYDISTCEYYYLKDINLNDWVAEIDRKKRMEELRREMESKFAEIDKQKKFEYYAQIDDDFRELYLEYEDLNKK
jgi:hypothetical protein